METVNYMLSIVTINKNNKSGLELTMKSVLSQICRKDLEWVVIDGASTDGSVDLLKQNENNIDFWMSEKDEGIYNAMNKGIIHSKGKFILFLNSGDFLYNTNTISEVLPYLCNSDFYIGTIAIEGNNSVASPYITAHSELSKEQIIDKLLFKQIPHPATFIKREVFIKEGMYDEKYRIISDWIFFYNCLFLKNYKAESLPLTISYFDTTGISSTNSSLHQKDSRLFTINNPGIVFLNDFYRSNFNLIKDIHSNKLVYLMVRLLLKIDKIFLKLFHSTKF